MKKAVLSVVFIGLFSWFGLFSEQTPVNKEVSQRSGVPKAPIKW